MGRPPKTSKPVPATVSAAPLADIPTVRQTTAARPPEETVELLEEEYHYHGLRMQALRRELQRQGVAID